MQSDRWIFERVDDSAGCIATAYRRACQLFARAAAGVASPAALAERIALLVEKDDYGVRHSLLEHVPQFLDNETIARLVDRRRKQAVQGPGSRRESHQFYGKLFGAAGEIKISSLPPTSAPSGFHPCRPMFGRLEMLTCH